MGGGRQQDGVNPMAVVHARYYTLLCKPALSFPLHNRPPKVVACAGRNPQLLQDIVLEGSMLFLSGKQLFMSVRTYFMVCLYKYC